MAKKKRAPANPKKPVPEPTPEPAPDEAVAKPVSPEPSTPKVAIYAVKIPGCLLGEKFIQAADPQEALDKYRDPCGITSHAQPAEVLITDLDPNKLPEGVSLYGGD